ncbi:hypothetical protein D3C73_1630400 [compost metagenome]
MQSGLQGFIRDLGEIGPLGEKLPQEAIGILIGAALPGGIRICEIHLYAMSGFQAGVTGKLLATVCGSGLKCMGRIL